MISEVTLTIVVCTYNRAELLRYCLQSLVDQNNDTPPFNVIVVDNNSTDNTADVSQEFVQSLKLTLLTETNVGLSYARNLGLKSSGSTWVAYLDDDAIARPNWVKEIFKTVEKGTFKAFGGVYLPWYLYGKVPWFLDDYGSNKRFFPKDGTYELSGIQFISGGNAAYQRDILLDSGGFPTDLGMRGNELMYGEEIVAQKAIKERGHSIGVNTNMIIDHLVPLSKQTVQFQLQSASKKGDVYWRDKKRRLLGLVILFFQGLASVLLNFLISTFLVLSGRYRKENFVIHTGRKIRFYMGALKGYKL